MAGFFGYVGSVVEASALNVRAVTRVLMRRGSRIRSIEDRDVDGRLATMLVECDDADSRSTTVDDRQEGPMLAPVLLFDGPRRDVMAGRMATIREVDSFVMRELDVGTIGGGFAFAIWGRRHRTLALGCDAAGLRPVYFVGADTWFAFSTDIAAFLASNLLKRHLSSLDLRTYLRDGGVPDGCMVNGVLRLRPGSYVILRPFTSSTGRLRCSEAANHADGVLADMRETVAAQISRGDPAVLVSRDGSDVCSGYLDAVRQAGAGSIVRLAFSPADAVGKTDVVDHVVDLSAVDPVNVLDGVLASWDQPIADGIVEWLSAAETRRLGSRLLLSDLAEAEHRPQRGSSLVERALKRNGSEAMRPIFDEREIEKLCGPPRDEGEESKNVLDRSPRHRIALASLRQMATAHSIGFCAPGLGIVTTASHQSFQTGEATDLLPTGMIRSWILDHYHEQALDALHALAESGALNSVALQNYWNRFRFDVEPAMTARIWALVTLGAWVRDHEISGVA